MKADEYRQLLAQASESTRRLNSAVAAGVSASVAEPGAVPPLASRPKVKAGITSRRRVRFTIATCRLRDPDNTVVKWCVDALRYEGIIADDREQDIALEVRQVKVGSKKFEGNYMLWSTMIILILCATMLKGCDMIQETNRFGIAHGGYMEKSFEGPDHLVMPKPTKGK